MKKFEYIMGSIMLCLFINIVVIGISWLIVVKDLPSMAIVISIWITYMILRKK